MAPVSFIIPTYNGKRFLVPCIESILRQTVPPAEIIVVDDGSPEPSDSSFVREQYAAQPKVRVFRNEANLGFAGSVNRGIAEARHDYIALINNDTELDPLWSEKALPAFYSSEFRQIGSVATRIVRWDDNQIMDSAGDLYSVAGGAAKFKQGRPAWESGPRRSTFSACAAAALYRRDALRDVALSTPNGVAEIFDHSFGSYYEDVDLGFRLRLAGWQCVFEPSAICKHHVSASYSSTSWTYHYRSSRNAEIVYWSNMPRPLILAHGLKRILFLFCQAAFKFKNLRLLPWLCGKAAFLGRLGSVRTRRKFTTQKQRISFSDLEKDLEKNWLRIYWGGC